MTPDRTDLDHAAWLAGGLAQQVERLARRLGAPEAAAHAARLAAAALSRAASDGDAWLPLARVAAECGGSEGGEGAERGGSGVGDAAFAAALAASGVVGDAAAPGVCPLVLDGDRLYLHRYFDHARSLAAHLAARAGRPHPQPLPASTLLRADAGASDSPDWQRIAAALALRNRMTVISGGPGTGKTSTVALLLGALLDVAPDARIALAAPTGKAAARMVEALRARADALPAALRARLPAGASTVHRLLGIDPASGRPRRDAANPLPVDLLVVDEGSMLDLALARKLFDALPDDARIVLLGDKDQLEAVEAGSVFADLAADPSLGDACRAELAAATGVEVDAIVPPATTSAAGADAHDGVVWLQTSWRFGPDSGIGRLAAAVKAGDADAALRILRDGAPDLRWFDDAGSGIGAAALDAIRDGYAAYLEAVRRARPDPLAVLATFERFRVLCAVRDGPRGVGAVNAAVERRLGFDARAEPWYAGRPVIVTRNDPLNGRANGDVGVALRGADGSPSVWFADAGGARAVAAARLPPHETAFAMTVHRAQGSEFDRVLLVLPARSAPVVTRELVYTAVTRGRQAVPIAAAEGVLRAAIVMTAGKATAHPPRAR